MWEFIFLVIEDYLSWVFRNLIVYPIVIIIATPYTIIASLVKKGDFKTNLIHYHFRLYNYWWYKIEKPTKDD